MYRSSQHRVLNAGCTNKIRSKTGRRLLSALVVTMGLLCVFSQGHAGSLFTSQFASNSEGFTYLDDTFRATNAAYYASGAWISSGGSDAAGGSGGGALRVLLGGINDNVVNGMSGGWRKTFTLDTPSEVLLSFYYKLTQSAEYESDEKSQALVSVDGTLRGQAPNDYIVQIVGDGNGGSPRTTGWQYFEINLGVLSAGEHSIVVGGYNNKKTYRDETTEVLIDDVTVSSDNLAPVLDPLGNKSVSEGQLLQFTVTASDPDGDNLTYSAGSLPEGASFDPLTQTFTWTPGYGQSGTYSGVVFTVTDDGTPVENDSETITITVTNVNRAPVLDPIGNKSVNEGQLLQFTVTATDPDGDGLVYSASNLPPGATFNATTRVFSWTPGYGQSGSYTVVLFTVTDNGTPAQNDSEIITIAVANVNRPPVLDPIENKSVSEGQLLQFTVSASDPDSDTLTYSASNLPTGATFNASTKTFSWTPGYSQSGTYADILFTVTDNGSPAQNDSETITVTVTNVNQPPMLDPIGNKSVSEGQPLQFTVTATDPDGDGLACSASNLPTGATFDTTTRVFSWTPGYGQSGTYSNVLFTVTDNGSPVANDSEAVTISVGNVNRPPVLDPIGNKSVNEGQLLEFSVTATDPDGDGLAYSASNLPTGANFNAATRIFTWTPAFGQSGTYAAVLFAVTDNGTPAEGDSEAVTISVGNVNRPPVLDPIGNKSVNESQLLEFSVTATDPDGDGLAYSASNLPAGANFNTSTKTFTWTPGYGQAGTYSNVLFTVTDNGSPVENDSEAITITVENINRPPTLDPVGNKTINEGDPLEFTVTATDPDGDGLTYSASNLPSGAGFNPTTRMFTWVPDYWQAGSYSNVLFTVTDNGSPAAGDSEAITITVANVNLSPALEPIGNRTVNEGDTLQFTVAATDPDGNALTYSADNLPSGASFDPTTQVFTWTPGYGQAESYSNVLFTVTDNGTPPASDSESVSITVGDVNRAPILDPIGNKTVNEEELLEFTVSATDPDGDTLTYSVSNLPPGATFNPTTGVFSWTPSYGQAGNYTNVLFTLTDNGTPAGSDSESISIAVGDVNRSPVLEPIGNKTVSEAQQLQFTVTATDPDLDSLTYSASNLPSGASFDAATHVFSWTPNYGAAGNYTNVLFVVTDNGTPLASDSESISITVGDVNRPPVLAPIGNKTVDEGELLEFVVTATDPDGDNLTYSADILPLGASFDPATRMFSWTPDSGQMGNYTDVLFTVTDDGTPPVSDSETITITVGQVNRPPVLDPVGNKALLVTDRLDFTVTGTDPDGDSLTYSASNLPEGASFDPVTQSFHWAPNWDQAQIHHVVFTATDDGLPPISDSESVTITVLELYPRDFQIDKVTLMDLDRGTNTRNFSPGTDISYKVKFSMLLAHPLKQYKVVVTGKVSSLYRPGGTPEWTDKLDNPRVRLSKNISFNETRFVRWESRIPIDATPGHQAKVKFKIELKEYDEVTETWGVVETLYETKRFNIVP
jgi:hypothetical protein